MTKLWLSLGLINLIVSVAILFDQKLRFNVWWEWNEFLHHEVFIGIFSYAAFVLIIVALVEYIRNLKRV